LPCRREVARVMVHRHEIKQGKSSESMDQVTGHIKFKLVWLTDLDGPFLDIADTQNLIRQAFDLCYASNQTFNQGQWIHPGVHAMNVSYVEMPWAPKSTMETMRSVIGQRAAGCPIPGWIDLLHLTLDIRSHTTHALCYRQMLVKAAQRMKLSVDDWLQDRWTAEQEAEVVADAAATVARRSVYLPDTVDVTPPNSTWKDIRQVDYYGFPRLVDRLHFAGDDCESLSKET